MALAAFAGVWVGVVVLGDSWWQLLLAAALGLVVTQFGFLGHDASHRQIFAGPGGTTGPHGCSPAPAPG